MKKSKAQQQPKRPVGKLVITSGLQVNCRKCDKFTPGVCISRDKMACAICGEAL